MHRHYFPYPHEIKLAQRSSVIQEIMLNIYDKGIPLHESLMFVEKIESINALSSKASRVDRIKTILKVSTVFFIMYLSMFAEHEGENLREEQVMSFMKIVEDLLKGLADQKERFVSNSDHHFDKIWYHLLHSSTVPDRTANRNISTAWKTFEYWMELKMKQKSLPAARYAHKCAIHVISLKIIFFSNLKKIYQLFETGKQACSINTR
jgi:hypothetical protein